MVSTLPKTAPDRSTRSMSATDIASPPDPSPNSTAEAMRAAFRELHGRRLHGFALLLTLGDRPSAARLASEALADGAMRVEELRHPERAAAWLRHRVVERARVGRARTSTLGSCSTSAWTRHWSSRSAHSAGSNGPRSSLPRSSGLTGETLRRSSGARDPLSTACCDARVSGSCGHTRRPLRSPPTDRSRPACRHSRGERWDERPSRGVRRLADAGRARRSPTRGALHASACPGCLRAAGAFDALTAIDLEAAEFPPLRVAAAPVDRRRGLVPATAAAIAVLLVIGAGIVAGGTLLRPPDEPESQSRRRRSARACSVTRAVRNHPHPTARRPSASPRATATGSPEPSSTEGPVAPNPTMGGGPPLATPAPPPITPRPTAAPSPRATAAPTPAPTPIPTPTSTPVPPGFHFRRRRRPYFPDVRRAPDGIDTDGDRPPTLGRSLPPPATTTTRSAPAPSQALLVPLSVDVIAAWAAASLRPAPGTASSSRSRVRPRGRTRSRSGRRLLTADPDLQLRLRGSPLLYAHLDELADTGDVNTLEWILGEDLPL